MSHQPPLLPAETLNRVLRRAWINGAWVMIVSSFYALLSATEAEVPDVVVALLIAGGGAMALHGYGMLTRGDARGMRWLVTAPLLCMLMLLGICAWQVTHVDLPTLRTVLAPQMKEVHAKFNLTDDQYLTMIYWGSNAILALVAIFYPGGLALYFLRRRAAVATALAQE